MRDDSEGYGEEEGMGVLGFFFFLSEVKLGSKG